MSGPDLIEVDGVVYDMAPDAVYARLFIAGMLLDHTRPSWNGSMCAYRGDGGTRCVVGHAFPGLELAEGEDSQNALRACGIRPSYVTLGVLADAQRIHDGMVDPAGDWWPSVVPVPYFLDKFEERHLGVDDDVGWCRVGHDRL